MEPRLKFSSTIIS